MNIGNGITIILFVLKGLIILSFLILITRLLKEGILKTIFKFLTRMFNFVIITFVLIELSFKLSYFIGSFSEQSVFVTNFIYHCLLLVSIFLGMKISIPLSDFFLN